MSDQYWSLITYHYFVFGVLTYYNTCLIRQRGANQFLKAKSTAGRGQGRRGLERVVEHRCRICLQQTNHRLGHDLPADWPKAEGGYLRSDDMTVLDFIGAN